MFICLYVKETLHYFPLVCMYRRRVQMERGRPVASWISGVASSAVAVYRPAVARSSESWWTPAGRPVENTQLLLITPRRQVITNRDGMFRLNDVGDGAADLTARKIGYYPVRTRFEIASIGSTVRIALVPLVRTLAAVLTTARRDCQPPRCLRTRATMNATIASTRASPSSRRASRGSSPRTPTRSPVRSA